MNNNFSSLARDFGTTTREVRRLASACGVSIRPRWRSLTDYEIDKLYDMWLSSNIKGNDAGDKMIFIDTSSLLHHGAEKFLKNSTVELFQSGQKLIIPFVVITELNRKALQSDDVNLAKRARSILQSILNYKEMGVIAVYGDDNDGSFADNVFHKVATMFALRCELVFITQDYKLGQDLLMMSHMDSVRNRKISVYKISMSGQLILVNWKG